MTVRTEPDHSAALDAIGVLHAELRLMLAPNNFAGTTPLSVNFGPWLDTIEKQVKLHAAITGAPDMECQNCGQKVRFRGYHYVPSVGHYTEPEGAMRPRYTCVRRGG